MLCLTRARGEEIVIRVPPCDEETEIVLAVLDFEKVTDYLRREVRLGIDAPRDVSIHRAEVQDQIDGVE